MAKRGLCFSSHDPEKPLSEKDALFLAATGLDPRTPRPTEAELTMLAGAGISWFYNWGRTPKVEGPAGGAPWTSGTGGMDFVPMLHKLSSSTSEVRAVVASNPAIRHLLVLNEPSHRKQAWASPEEAATHWPEWERLARELNLSLVGPQLAYGGQQEHKNPVDWMNAFLTAYRSEHNGCEPKVDAIGFHFYGSHGLWKNLDLLKEAFHKPIWLTEFSRYNATSVDEQKAWMKKHVRVCEKHPSVERYSWFIARSVKHPHLALLGADGALTELGQYYASLPRARANTAAAAAEGEGGAPSADEAECEGGVPSDAEAEGEGGALAGGGSSSAASGDP
jgi:hypothetical protein